MVCETVDDGVDDGAVDADPVVLTVIDVETVDEPDMDGDEVALTDSEADDDAEIVVDADTVGDGVSGAPGQPDVTAGGYARPRYVYASVDSAMSLVQYDASVTQLKKSGPAKGQKTSCATPFAVSFVDDVAVPSAIVT